MRRKIVIWLLMIGFCFAAADKISAQDILLDRGIKAGKLDCFPVYGNEKTFYYLPANPRLVEKDGKPQFSFIKYVQNVASGGDGGTTEGKGGGLVHFLVAYGATEDERMEAEQALQETVPEARLAGPVIYRSGTYALVTSFTEKNGDLAREVVGLGKAPIMEGHKAAVSMHLTKKGASLLWESFKNPTSQISVTFEMTVKGYRNPYEARLTADWSKMFKHRRIAAGMKYKWLGADIDMLFQEFKESGALKIEVKGQDNDMDKIWAKAQDLLMKKIFEKDPAIDSLEKLQKGDANFNNLDRAIDMINGDKKKKNGNTASLSTTAKPSGDPGVFNRKEFTVPSSSVNVYFMRPHGPFYDMDADTAPADEKKTKPKGRAKPKKATPVKKASPPTKAKSKPTAASKPAPKTGKKSETSSGFALIASYHMKEIKKSGKAVLDLKRWTQDSFSFRFDENIGGMDRYFNDKKFFRAVNLDDPVFKQREIVVLLDGQDAGIFAKYVNYVTVQVRKKHENGEMSHDELKIDKANFNKEGNKFIMLYGWKGDNNRAQWLTYQYKTRWSFHGGVFFEDQWKTTDDFSITVTPPHRYRELSLEIDPEVFKEKQVRDASVKFYSHLYGKELTRQVTIRTRENISVKPLEYVHPEGNFDYEYEVTWRLRGGVVLRSGRKKSSGDTIYCDELAEQ